MMHSRFRKVFSMLMAFVVMFSTMSFAVSMHYCGDSLVETAFFKKAEGCGMEVHSSSMEVCVFTKKSCCEDKQLIIQGQDELQLSFDKSPLEKQFLVALKAFAPLYLFDGGKQNNTLKPYEPPLVVRQLYVLHSVYLI
jgi:hypothetical protein